MQIFLKQNPEKFALHLELSLQFTQPFRLSSWGPDGGRGASRSAWGNSPADSSPQAGLSCGCSSFIAEFIFHASCSHTFDPLVGFL